MKWIIPLVAAATAFIAHQALDAQAIGVDSPTLTSCNTDGLEVSYDTEFSSDEGGYAITVVTVENIDASCQGSQLELTLTGINGEVLAQTTEQITGVTVDLPISGALVVKYRAMSALIG